MKLITVMITLSTDVTGIDSLNLMFSRSLKYSSAVLLALLLLATAVATAALMLSMDVVVKFLRWTSVASNLDL